MTTDRRHVTTTAKLKDWIFILGPLVYICIAAYQLGIFSQRMSAVEAGIADVKAQIVEIRGVLLGKANRRE